jgi:hypothetical protein
MKRATYSIPAVGVGLALSGCGDPIVGTDFAVTSVSFIGDQAVPFTDTYDGVDANGAAFSCAISITATNITIGDDLTGSFTYVFDALCDNAAYNANYTYNVAATATAVEKGAKYNIAITSEGGDFALTCDMDANLNLACADADAGVWTFAAQ